MLANVRSQTGLDLPHDKKMVEPNYQELTAEQIPSVHPTENITVKVIAGSAQGSEEEGLVKSPVTPVGGAEYYDVKMAKSGETYWQAVRNSVSRSRVLDRSASQTWSLTLA